MFRNNRKSFAVIVVEQKLYVLTSTDDVTTIYRNVTIFFWEIYLNDFLIVFELDSFALIKIWRKLIMKFLIFNEKSINLLQKSLILLTENLYKQQLFFEIKLDVFEIRFISLIDEDLRWEKLKNRFVLFFNDERRHVSLFKFCEQFLVKIITKTMFDDFIYDFESNLTEHLLNFNDDVWMFIFNYLQFVAKRLYHARKKILNVLKCYMKYFKKSKIEKFWFIEIVMTQQMMADVDEQNKAKMLLMIYWA